MNEYGRLKAAFPDLAVVEVVDNCDHPTITGGSGDFDRCLRCFRTIDWKTMTDAINVIDAEWADGDPEAEGTGYPEYPANPHNHRFTISFDPTKPPFVVVRANTAAELREAFDELAGSGAYSVMNAAYAALRSAGAPAPAPQAPNQFQQQAQQQFNQQPAQQFPGQPGTAPASWQNVGAPAPQQQWGGQQGQQGQQGGTRAVPKPKPNGWYQTDKNSGPGADAWKAMRENNQPMVKGKISWGGGSTFWVDPSIAQWVASQGFALMAA